MKSSSSTSWISSGYMNHILQKLNTKKVRDTTARNYLNILKCFNTFLIRQDKNQILGKIEEFYTVLI